MHRFRLIWVGRTDKGFPQEAVAHYLKRLRPLAEVDCIEVRGAGHSGRDPEQVRTLEAESILKRIGPEERVIALDERGREMDSVRFSAWITERSPATLVLGGAYGLGDAVRSRAADTLSLSRMTLPHQLARVVLLEQLYRALSLYHGHGYHHG